MRQDAGVSAAGVVALCSNVSMQTDRGFDNVCKDPVTGNTTACDKASQGISLSVPILMFSSGVIGNVIAIIVLATSKAEVRKTVFFTLLVGLAVTDLVGQLATSPIAVVVYAHNMQWQGGLATCYYHGYVMVCFGMITPLIVMLMSLERLLALRWSYFYARVVTRKKAILTYLGLCLFTVFVGTWPFMGFGSYAHQYPGSWCFLNFHQESPTDSAYAYFYALINIAAMITIIVANITVVVTLLQLRRRRRINNSPSIDRKRQVRPRSILHMEMETQMVWFLGAITVVFCICWFPLNVNIIINQIHDENNYPRDLMSVRLAGINQILDPWLYILLRRKTFFKALHRLKRYVASKRSGTPNSTSAAQHELSRHPANCYQLKSISDQLDSQAKLVPGPRPDVQSSDEGGSPAKAAVPFDSVIVETSDSDSDVFLETERTPRCGRKRSFLSMDDRLYRSSRGSRDSGRSGSRKGSSDQAAKAAAKPHKSRLYSLPSYLKPNEKNIV